MSPHSAPALSIDLPCIHCGYNLRTLTRSSLCPECGCSIADSLIIRPIHDRIPGLRLLAAATVLMAAGAIGSIVGLCLASSGSEILLLILPTVQPFASGVFLALVLPEVSPDLSLTSLVFLGGALLRLTGLALLSIRPRHARDSLPGHRLLLRVLLALVLAIHLLGLLPAPPINFWETSLSYLVLAVLLLIDGAIIWISSTLLLSIISADNWRDSATAIDGSRMLALFATVTAPIGLFLANLPSGPLPLAILNYIGACFLIMAIGAYLAAAGVSFFTVLILCLHFSYHSLRRPR